MAWRGIRTARLTFVISELEWSLVASQDPTITTLRYCVLWLLVLAPQTWNCQQGAWSRDSTGLRRTRKPEHSLCGTVTPLFSPPPSKPQTPISSLAPKFPDAFLPLATLNNGDIPGAEMRRVGGRMWACTNVAREISDSGGLHFLHAFRKVSGS